MVCIPLSSIKALFWRRESHLIANMHLCIIIIISISRQQHISLFYRWLVCCVTNCHRFHLLQVGIEMQRFPSFSSDLELIERMVAEESVFCLPGACFDYPNFMRLVLTVPTELMIEACNRLEFFFERYFVAERISKSSSLLHDSNSSKGCILLDDSLRSSCHTVTAARI